MERKLSIFIDFDGTISRQDVSSAMLAQFCQGDWRRFDRLWEQGAINTGECAAAVLEMMKASPAELDSFFGEQEIDPSFPAFVSWAAQRHAALYVLSDGFDNYIRIISDKFGLIFDYYANHLVYDGGWRMECPHSSPGCPQCGVCKKELIEKLRTPGDLCIYVGDGYSDACAAPTCDLIYAKDQLAVILRDQGLPFHEFANFSDIRQSLESLYPGRF